LSIADFIQLTDAELGDHVRRVNELVVDGVRRLRSTRDVALEAHAMQGKRLRSRLALAVAGERLDERHLFGCAAIELIHLATLVHDDIIDESPTRRGIRTTWSAFGRDRALVAGDALFGAAFECASAVSTDFVSQLAGGVAAVCDGQMAELADVGLATRTPGRVEQIAASKTGGLFGVAVVLGSPVEHLASARAAGTLVGLLYQLLDDLEDVDAAGVGQAADLAGGLLTEPWLFALDESQFDGLHNLRFDVDASLNWLWRGRGPDRAIERMESLHAELLDTSAPDVARTFAAATVDDARRVVARNRHNGPA
jgi:geranylgeranyl pyrophosphate synthase